MKDRKECRDLAQTEVAQIHYFYDFYDMGYMYDFPFYAPTIATGTAVLFSVDTIITDFYNSRVILNDFFRVCMKVKGWQRVKIKPELK